MPVLRVGFTNGGYQFNGVLNDVILFYVYSSSVQIVTTVWNENPPVMTGKGGVHSNRRLTFDTSGCSYVSSQLLLIQFLWNFVVHSPRNITGNCRFVRYIYICLIIAAGINVFTKMLEHGSAKKILC